MMLLQVNFNFQYISGAWDSWYKYSIEQILHIKNSGWIGNGATESNPLRYRDISSQNKVKILSPSTWKSWGSVYVLNKGSSGKVYYATFQVPPMAGNMNHVLTGRFTTDRYEYRISSGQQSATVSYSVNVDVNLSGYMRSSHISQLSAEYRGRTNESKTTSAVKNGTFNLNRSSYSVGTHYITLEGKVSLKTIFGDKESKTVRRTIKLVVEPDIQPTVDTTTMVEPSIIHQPYSRDETVNVKVSGSIKDLAEPSQISFYQIYARPLDDASAFKQSVIYSQSRTASSDFTFVIPKSKINNTDFTQTYIGRVRVWLKDGTYITSTDTDSVTIYPATRPVAAFTPIPRTTTVNNTVFLRNDSYDPNNDSISNSYWYVKEPGESSYRYFSSSYDTNNYVNEPGNYTYRLRVRNSNGQYSDYAYETVTVKNTAPVADFKATPTTVNKGDPVKLTNLSYDSNGDSLTYEWWYKEKMNSSYVKFSTSKNPVLAISELGNYSIRLRVRDKWGAYSNYAYEDVKVEKSDLKAGFTHHSPYYIGDTIIIYSSVSSSPGESLTYSYKVTKPNGQVLHYNSSSNELSSNGDLTISAVNQSSDLGNWRIEQTVSNGTDSATSSGMIQVLDQTVSGLVKHTDKWNENRKKFNLRKTGKENEPRSYSVFYPGEKFLLDGTATDLAYRVNVKILEYPFYKAVLNYNSRSQAWEGEIWDKAMLTQLNNETLTFEFTALFYNGWIARDIVKVEIWDEEYWRPYTSY